MSLDLLIYAEGKDSNLLLHEHFYARDYSKFGEQKLGIYKLIKGLYEEFPEEAQSWEGSMTFSKSFLELNAPTTLYTEIFQYCKKMANENGLVLYNPQDDSTYFPTNKSALQIEELPEEIELFFSDYEEWNQFLEQLKAFERVGRTERIECMAKDGTMPAACYMSDWYRCEAMKPKYSNNKMEQAKFLQLARQYAEMCASKAYAQTLSSSNDETAKDLGL
ncbi:MAG: hypothetical protein IPK73_22760 [Candidatus Obscuribacter sp.]|nr:hypothetical protein [Candidatus Obscuribacter sp.]MBK9276933.1 hypothetical protein [Candidatus Obscuribacter sp.]